MNTHRQQKVGQEQKPIVLIVDDVPANLALLFDYLEQEDFRVLIARSGANALLQIERLKPLKPDIMLLDVMMPGMDGFETCELLKANSEMCEIPVIFLTAMDDPHDKVRGFELGAVDYITKPIQEVEVLARLRTHLTIRNLQNRLKVQLDFAQKLVRERNAQLSHTNQELTQLNSRYEAEMAQRKHQTIEQNRLFTIIAQQSEQWRTLSHFLMGEADTAGQGLARELNEQASQNLGLVLHSLNVMADRIDDSIFLPRDKLLSQLHQALKMLESTKSYLDKASQACADAGRITNKPRVSQEVLSALTPRERDVFQLLVDGESTSEISHTLLLAEGSIRTYRNRIMKKLEISSLAGLIKFAIKHGLTELD